MVVSRQISNIILQTQGAGFLQMSIWNPDFETRAASFTKWPHAYYLQCCIIRSRDCKRRNHWKLCKSLNKINETKCWGYGDTNSIELNPTSDFVKEWRNCGYRQKTAVRRLVHQNGKEATTVALGQLFPGYHILSLLLGQRFLEKLLRLLQCIRDNAFPLEILGGMNSETEGWTQRMWLAK